VRWALEEAGLPYEERLMGPQDQRAASYRTLQPFGQLPVLEDGELSLFESGSILLYLAEKSDVLFPEDKGGRERARTWVIAALNSIEPFVQNLTELDLFHAKEEWAKARRPACLEALKGRLASLSQWLEGREYLEGRFSVADLIMTTVLRIPRHIPLLAEFPILDAYVKRCEARPAFKKALAAQMQIHAENAPPK
jgi:glutathione S-transferase